jgi:hypothetical protein
MVAVNKYYVTAIFGKKSLRVRHLQIRLLKTPSLRRCMITLLLNRPENSFLDFTSLGHTMHAADISLQKWISCS